MLPMRQARSHRESLPLNKLIDDRTDVDRPECAPSLVTPSKVDSKVVVVASAVDSVVDSPATSRAT